MSAIQTIIGVTFLLIGGYVVMMNWLVVVQWIVRKKHSSWIPIVGGAFVTSGMIIVPYSNADELWWVPLFADWGCIPGLTLTGLHYIWLRLKHGRT